VRIESQQRLDLLTVLEALGQDIPLQPAQITKTNPPRQEGTGEG
jgi:hypothetical protein